MKIYMEHKTYTKDGNKWILRNDWGKEEISEATYLHLRYEKWSGDRRVYKFLQGYGKMMIKLTNTEPIFQENKSVREFTFED